MTEERQDAVSATPSPAPKGRGKRWLIGMGALAAVLALVIFAGGAFAAPPRGPRMPGANMAGASGGFGRGIEAVVTGVDMGGNTITLAGLPSQISTVNVNGNVKLVTVQADGSTQPAAIGDFKSGSLVRVSFGRTNGNATGNATTTPGAGNRGFNLGVTQLALVPDNITEVSGVVLANNNGTYTIASAGGLRLTIKTQGNTTYTMNRNASASASDVKVGSRITVSGTQAPDGITATSVRIMDFSNFPMMGGQNGRMPGTRMPGARMPGANTSTPTATATT